MRAGTRWSATSSTGTRRSRRTSGTSRRSSSSTSSRSGTLPTTRRSWPKSVTTRGFGVPSTRPTRCCPAASDAALSEAALLDSGFAVSPLAWPLRYRFPVHRIGVDFQPVATPAAATWLIVYRDRGDRVGYLESNPATTRLLALLGEDGTAREALSGLGELGRDAESLLGFGATVLRRLVEHDIAPVSCEGVRAPPAESPGACAGSTRATPLWRPVVEIVHAPRLICSPVG